MVKSYYIFAHGEHFVDGVKQRTLHCFNGESPIGERFLKPAMKLPEEALNAYFNGCDYKEYVNTINGVEDVLQGVTYTDVMGQQCLEVTAVTEQEMIDTILDKFKKDGINNILDIDCDEETYWDWSGYDGVTKYLPLQIIERTDEDGDIQYDVVCKATYENGDTATYVENIYCIGFYILFNVYNTIIHS